MRKWVIILFALLAMTSFTIADTGEIETYRPGEVFDLSIHLSNLTGDAIGASCNILIMNQSFRAILQDSMNEIGGGWYNYTYNQSRIGKYYCRQNCTQGSLYDAGTCDFIIGVDDNMLIGMIVFIPLFIAAFMLLFAFFLPQEKWWGLKIALPFLGLVFIFQSYQYASIGVAETLGTTGLIDAMGSSTFYYGMVFFMLVAVLIIYIVYEVFMLFGKKKHKTGDY